MDCSKCRKSDKSESVYYIIENGTDVTESQSDVIGHHHTNTRGKFEGDERYNNVPTGVSYTGTYRENAQTSSFETHSSVSVRQSNLASRLDNVFGSPMQEPEVIFSPEAEQWKANRFLGILALHGLGALVPPIWLGAATTSAYEGSTASFFVSAIILGGPIAVLILGVGVFRYVGVYRQAVDESYKSPLNRKRRSIVNAYNKQLSSAYADLNAMNYCARCNGVSDGEKFYGLSEIATTGPTIKALPSG